MSEITKAVSVSKKVVIGEEEIIVQKLPLGQYSKLILALRNMPSGIVNDLQGIDTENEDESITAIINLFGQSWGQILEVISIGSGVDKDRIENDPAIGLDGGVELFLAIYEVNNLNKVFKQIKNAMNRSKAQ